MVADIMFQFKSYCGNIEVTISQEKLHCIEKKQNEATSRCKGAGVTKDVVALKVFRPLPEAVHKYEEFKGTVKGEKHLVEAAIVIRGAEKCYGKGQQVLAGLNMTVACGSIYALLGSSGCGKSTLLSCILSILKLDRGSIYLFGVKAGTSACRTMGIPGSNIGYMPQDLSLYSEFTISEMLRYSGTLCGHMHKKENERKLLFDLLDLPDGSRKVGSLSAGQQRRVSFAVALFHKPRLIVLDEPTVGVDPILRQSIWNHLKQLVSSRRVTILVTTHYIEEAREAQMIGVMRDGVLLAENSPQHLLTYCNTSSLQEAVLHLCKIKKESHNQEETPNGGNNTAIVPIVTNCKVGCPSSISLSGNVNNPAFGLPSFQKFRKSKIKSSVNRISALVLKNFILISRNLLLFSFVSWIPAIQIAVACLGYGQDPRDVLMGVVNHELGFQGNPSNCLNVELGHCDLTMLSCRYLSSLPEGSVKLVDFHTENDAIAAVHQGSIWGYFLFLEDFSQSFVERALLASNVSDELWNASTINVRLDETNKLVGVALKMKAFKGLENFSKRLLSECGYDPKKAEYSLDFRAPVMGTADLDMHVYGGVGIAMPAIYFFPIITAGIRLLHEKQCGMLERSLVFGMYLWEFILAYAITEVFVLLVQIIFIHVVLLFIFQIYNYGSFLLTFVLLYLSGYMGISMGIFLGFVCREKIEVAILAMAFFLPNLILCGVNWPIEGMPEILRYVSVVLPCTMPTEAFRSVFNRGWDVTHPYVWPGIVVCVCYILCFNFFTIIFYRFIKK